MTNALRCLSVAAVLLGLLGPLNAQTFEARLAAARALLDEGKKVEARPKFENLKEDIKKSLAEKPDEPRLNFLYGCICMDGGFDDDAAKFLDKAIAGAPKNVAYLSTRATLWEYQEKPAEAVPLWQRATVAEPATVKLWTNLCRAQEHAEKLPDAIESIRKAIQLEPGNAESHGTLGTLLMKSGRTDEALDAMLKSRNLDPNDPFIHLNIGQLHQTAGRHAESLAAYQKAIELEPGDYRAWAKVVQLCQALGKTTECNQAREKVIALWKDGKVESELYCREQFTHGKTRMMVFEYFELTGERAVRYAFKVVGEDGDSVEKITLGSYQTTTDVARETGSIKADERMFHLDHYTPNRHATLGMFRKEPTYEETRRMVIEFLDGKRKPMSSTTYP